MADIRPQDLVRVPLVALATLLCGVSGADAALPAKPNILLIVMDDLGISDLGAYGGTVIDTPELDSFAAASRQFEDYYSNGSVCSPTRVGILTGLDPARIGVRSNLRGEYTRGIPSDVVTLAELLGGEGYATSHFGKWHLGFSEAQFQPLGQGFDTSARSILDGSYFGPDFEIDDTTIVSHPGEHATDVTTDYAIAFMTANQAGPFFANVWYNAPHEPWEPPAEYAIKYPATDLGRYHAMIEHLDAEIGRLVDAVDALGIGQDTLIIVTSDNGSQFSNFPYAKGKGSVREGGIRSPMLVRATGTIPAGSSSQGLAVGFDLLPTFADLIGVDVSHLGLRGVSLAPAMLSGSPIPRSGELYWELRRHVAFPGSPMGERNRYAVRSGRWKLVNDDAQTSQLYDLYSDSLELTDLAGLNPNKVDELEVNYRAWRLVTGLIDHQVDAAYGDAVLAGADMIFGSSGGRVDLVSDTRFNVNDGEFTFDTVLTAATLGGVIASNPSSWSLRLRSDGRIELVVQAEGGGDTTLTSSTVVQPGLAHDVAFSVYGYGSSNNTVRLFIGGLQEAWTNEIPAVAPSFDAVLLGNDAGSTDPFEGTLTDPRFYMMAMLELELGGDADRDQIDNLDDNCPLIGNTAQLDFDADGAGDACDEDDDGDGLLDLFETGTGVYVSPFDTGTDPMNVDSDQDFIHDGYEVLAGSDPNDPLDRPGLMIPTLPSGFSIPFALAIWLLAAAVLLKRAGAGR